MHLKRAYVLRRNDALKKTSKPPSFAAALKPGDRESEQSNADEPPSLALAVNAASYAPSPSQFGFESPQNHQTPSTENRTQTVRSSPKPPNED
jgi:hypothetical protein